MKNSRKFKIGIAGAIESHSCSIEVLGSAEDLGKEIYKMGGQILIGSHPGFPLWVANGFREAGGEAVNFSPASDLREHKEAYRLPYEENDVNIFTGFGFVMNEVLLARNADAVIIGCGKPGSIHELSLAYEMNKPIGVLEGDWPQDEFIKFLESKKRGSHKAIVFEKDPKELAKKIFEILSHK